MKGTSKKHRYIRLTIPCGLLVAALSIAISPHAELPASNQAQAYTYDSTGRLTQVTYEGGYILRYIYDDNGNFLKVEVSRENDVFNDSFEALAHWLPASWRLWKD